ncbi:TPA: restriction endonuclease subunit S [Listeria innocua]|nr:restriction endonuclease subunit S [Listeria innocua]ELY0464594.1 restriction endonuclease subunit S [Listeria innocua]ELY0467474.1 restriction endonuclease subunit S [Listeria innocua]ELY0470426.1 restriction endonuclease subunit S [Listeria innocua]ELY0473379.1 restriction endonuclease subunit S [Listeria innocua]
MEDILIPKEINIQNIISKKYSLSPTNYKKVDIQNSNKIKLNKLLGNPSFIRGTEPGSSTYLKNLTSNIKFVRNSCVDKLNYIVQTQKSFFLNENVISYNENQLLSDGDIVVATDANIGDSALFLDDCSSTYLLSSGMVKINVKKNVNKYYLLAMLKDSYFNIQLDSMTPKGSTIRHSGANMLDCEIPYPSEKNLWVIKIIENLMKNITFAERRAQEIQSAIFRIFDNELQSIVVEEVSTKASDLFLAKRIDAGFYSEEVQSFFKKIDNYPLGSKNLSELGYKVKRGPNLAKRDLGRSIKSEAFRPNYSLLIYPSDISDFGYIDKTTFLGASGKVWFLGEKDILFSAEGNVGKTFAICDESMNFTTNFHGIIITPINKENIDIESTVFIATFLSYMKKMGIMDKLSVGGQGGSFAVQYWDILKFPNMDENIILKLKELYYSKYEIHPFEFNEFEMKKLGIYEISKLRTLCSSLLKLIVNDIKGDELHSEKYYIDQLNL